MQKKPCQVVSVFVKIKNVTYSSEAFGLHVLTGTMAWLWHPLCLTHLLTTLTSFQMIGSHQTRESSPEMTFKMQQRDKPYCCI